MTWKKLDYIDCKILNHVAEYGNAENLKKVARELNMTTATVHKRVKNMFKEGVIRKTQYDLNPEKLDLPLLALIAVKLEEEKTVDELNKKFGNSSNIIISLETYGAFDYLLGVYAKSPEELYAIKDKLKEMPGVNMLYSAFVGKKFRFSTTPFPLKEE